jgi:predicted HicB family RNase H-like nuclease
MRAIFFRVHEELYIKLKTECARRGVSLRALIIEKILKE